MMKINKCVKCVKFCFSTSLLFVCVGGRRPSRIESGATAAAVQQQSSCLSDISPKIHASEMQQSLSFSVGATVFHNSDSPLDLHPSLQRC